MFSARLAFISALALIVSAHPAAAQTPALGFTPGAYGVTDNASDTNVSSYSLGFEFTADSPLFVTSLGYFSDPSFDPTSPFGSVALSPEPTGSYTFASDHQVGLYQVVPGTASAPETGLLIASATVTQDSTANGDFLYQALTTAVPLVAGDTYVLTGVTGGTDPFAYNIEDDSQTLGATGLTVNGITYVEDRSTVSSALAFPGGLAPSSSGGLLGPNLLLLSPVPEAPTTLSLGLLLALGLAGLGLSTPRRTARSRRPGDRAASQQKGA